MEDPRYGIIHGEIVILPASRAAKDDMGIEIKVKGEGVVLLSPVKCFL